MKANTLLFGILISLSICAQPGWESTNGPEGLWVRYSDSNEDYIFVSNGSASSLEVNNLYRSADGETWERLNEFVESSLSTYGDEVVFISRKTENDDFSIRHSGDNGETWSNLPLPGPIIENSSLAICAHGIYLLSKAPGTFDVLYYTNDLGLNWQAVNLSSIGAAYNGHLVEIGGDLYVKSISNIVKYNPFEGISISYSPPLNSSPQDDLISFDVLGDTIVVGTSYGRIHRTEDGGNAWTTIDNDLGWLENLKRINGALYLLNRFGVEEILVSYDNGLNWQTFLGTNPLFKIDQILTFGDELFFFTRNQGIWLVNQDGTTESRNSGLMEGTVFELAVADSLIWAAAGTGLFYYNNLENEWNKIEDPIFPTEGSFRSIAHRGENILTLHESGVLFFSTDNGVSWSSCATTVNYHSALEVEVVGDNFYIFNGPGGSISTDFCNTFITSGNFSSNSKEIIEYRDSLYIAGGIYVMRSKDGLAWEAIASNVNLKLVKLFPTEFGLFGMSASPSTYPDLLESEVFFSVDGINWELAQGFSPSDFYYYDYNFHDYPYYYFFSYGDILFAIWDRRLSYSTDSGATWTYLESLNVPNLKNIGFELFMGGRGVYKKDLTDYKILGVNQEDEKFPFSFYPNPTEEKITLNLDPSSRFTEGQVSVYSSSGVLQFKKRVLFSEGKASFDIRSLIAGVYVLNLSIGNKKNSYQFVVID